MLDDVQRSFIKKGEGKTVKWGVLDRIRGTRSTGSVLPLGPPAGPTRARRRLFIRIETPVPKKKNEKENEKEMVLRFRPTTT